MAKRMQFCDNCGEELGVFERDREDIFLCCGKTECNREQNKAFREAEDEARWQAEQDHFARYR